MSLRLLDDDQPGEGAGPGDAIRAVVRRLSRPHASGGVVIERAAILASGADAGEIVTWILAHAGQAEASVPMASTRGLHGARMSGGPAGRAPRRAATCCRSTRSRDCSYGGPVRRMNPVAAQGTKWKKNGSMEMGTGVTPSLRSSVWVAKFALRW